MKIERLTTDAPTAEIRLIASRMRATLVEVLGHTRGDTMYDMAWLEDRVREHLDDARCCGAVFVARGEDGAIIGHTIVRVEEPDIGRPHGLFSTSYVVDGARRAGVASELLDAGEAWMQKMGMMEFATHTAHDNVGLIGLYEGRGYEIARRRDEMVRLVRRAPAAAED